MTKHAAPKKGRKLAALATAAIASISVLALGGPAIAAVGGGGAGGGGGSGAGASDATLYTLDNLSYQQDHGTPIQGWGQASIDYARSAIVGGLGQPSSESSFDSMLQSTCTTAITNAIARQPDAKTARVVGVALSYGAAGSGWDMWGMSIPAFQAAFQTNWDDFGADGFIGPNGSPSSYDPKYRNQVYNEFNAQIAAIGYNARMVYIALNDTEPPENYDLTLTTDAANTFTTAGGTGAVNDTVNASHNGAASQNEGGLNAQVTLGWDGFGSSAVTSGNPVASVTKTCTINNYQSGQCSSTTFTPADFGWPVWPGGTFHYTLSVPKQGHMAAGITHGGRDIASEKWQAAVPASNRRRTGCSHCQVE